MENIKEIITIASAALGLIATITGFLIPLVKNVKAKNKLTALNKLSATLQAFIVEAEAFTNFSGAEKKEYVMTKANRYALENKIAFDADAVSDKVEEIVELSKKVNKRGTSSSTEKNADAVSIRI